MSIYIDQSVDYGYGAVKEVPYARYWCHMFADTVEELHEFANRIGMKREWFQEDSKIPHYDLTKSRRNIAMRNGAIEISTKEYLRLLNLYK